ncbi:unnamed protein product [Dibothriocephalus latus]|uniref:Uncharacterized protein n=1 Tax=Dibothriocephalus latus TaxID=60516 RepID=A0A3P6T5J3_DIBLA|nr:unnamed protein product [Dibothriocephalus latus]
MHQDASLLRVKFDLESEQIHGKNVYESGLEEATAIFRKPDALLCLARQLAKSKPVSATYHPPEGCSDLENAVGLIDRLYGKNGTAFVRLLIMEFSSAAISLIPEVAASAGFLQRLVSRIKGVLQDFLCVPVYVEG